MLLSLKPDDSEATQTGCQFQLAMSTKPGYSLSFLKKNAVCLSIKAKNELRLLFQEIRHTSQIFPHLFHERLIPASFCKACCQMTSILFHPTPPILYLPNFQSRNTLVGFSPIPQPTSITPIHSADFPSQNPWQTSSSLRQETMHGGDLDPFWIAANPASEMLPKRAPTIKPQKQAYLGKTGGGQGIWMQYVSVSLKMATVPLIYMRHQYISIMSTSSLIFIASACTTVTHLNKMHTFVQPRTSLFLATEKLLDAVGESVSLQMIPKKMRDFSNSHNDNSRIFGFSQVTRLRESTKSPLVWENQCLPHPPRWRFQSIPGNPGAMFHPWDRIAWCRHGRRAICTRRRPRQSIGSLVRSHNNKSGTTRPCLQTLRKPKRRGRLFSVTEGIVDSFHAYSQEIMVSSI